MEQFGVICLIVLVVAGIAGFIALTFWLSDFILSVRRTQKEVDALFKHLDLYCTDNLLIVKREKE